jgi:hypothetical protein
LQGASRSRGLDYVRRTSNYPELHNALLQHISQHNVVSRVGLRTKNLRRVADFHDGPAPLR